MRVCERGESKTQFCMSSYLPRCVRPLSFLNDKSPTYANLDDKMYIIKTLTNQL